MVELYERNFYEKISMAPIICKRTRTVYFPAPKNASSSLRELFFELDNGFPFRKFEINGDLVDLFWLYRNHEGFKPQSIPAWIVLQNLPDNAEVLVDGEKVTVQLPDGGGPVQITVPPGRRGVQVEKDGFQAFGEEVGTHQRREANTDRPAHSPSPEAGRNSRRQRVARIL